MRGQDESFTDASSQARQSGILTPASDSSFNHEMKPGTSRKRKREGNTVEDLLSETFVVKPHPSTVFDKPRSLRPIALLPRSELPLACLDTRSSSSPLPDTRLFETHVKILELEERMGSTPMVLIARLDDGKTHFAVELEARGVYALCKIGSWVNLEKLCGGAVVSRYRSAARKNESGQFLALQTQTDIAQITPESSKYSKKKRLAIEAIQSMVKRPSGDLAPISQVSPILPEPTSVLESQTHAPAIIASPDKYIAHPVVTDDILDNIRSQYFEALYLSKASLAYFAKGPLSRARAAFHLDYDSTLDMKDLVFFLESLILSTTQLDKKYKDGVPILVSILDIEGNSEEGGENPKSKKRKNMKMKPGKNGLYPTEPDFIRKWWESHDDDGASGLPGDSLEDVARRRIADLRIRETQLQMIVVLETLALQPLATSSECQDGELPGGKDMTFGSTKPSVKPKKSKDLTALVDVHVDRLCIWQSVAAEGQSTKSASVLQTSETTDSNKHAADVLREFCVEVVVPFFSARLPEHCDSISRKLGGPVIPSPARPKLVKSTSSLAAPSRPGAVTKRPIPATRPGRSLRRVLTDERSGRSGSRGPSGVISLMRSATPSIPGLKREASEALSLNSIPMADSQSLSVNRGGVLKSKKFSSREVDLSAMAVDTKSKKASIEAELKDAISALKKPNRQLAGQSIVDTAEKRAASAIHSRKSKKPVRNPLFQGVQIAATPRTNRHKDMIERQPVEGFYMSARTEEQMPSSDSRVPQSVIRSHDQDDNPPEATPVLPRFGSDRASTVLATPSRKISNPSLGMVPASSPLKPRQFNMQQFLAVPAPRLHGIENFRTPTKTRAVPSTPEKGRLESKIQGRIDEMICPNTGEKPRVINDMLGSISQEDSIYKSLGWDDVDD